MSLLQDLLKEVPLSAVLAERVKLAEDNFAAANTEIEGLRKQISALEKENAELRAKIPQATGTGDPLSEDTKRVLVHMFRAHELTSRDIGAMAHALSKEKGIMTYHLDRLCDAGFAESAGGNYMLGHICWGLTPGGRRYVIEQKLT